MNLKKYLMIGAATLWASAAFGAHEGWASTLSPSQELHTPTVSGTNASCVATFKQPRKENGSLNPNVVNFSIRCLGLTDINAIHVHPGDADNSNPPIVTLFSSANGDTFSPQGVFRGFVAVGNVGAATFEQFFSALARDSGYVNVHTAADPNGAVRGQIVPVSVPDSPYLPF